ncbi:MAG TPA: Maf family protein [Balneolales bacterium]|nr:Maf family protein [Balneolales bacterium]
MNSAHIVLASASPRRKVLLEQINLSFTIQPSDVEEIMHPGQPPGKVAMQLADQKATDVSDDHANAVIIGADTVVVLEGRMLGKPEDAEEAFSMLKSLSGRTHEVYTGVALLKTDADAKIIDRSLFYARTLVTFDELDDQEIIDYIQTGSPNDKAGSYGIQDDWGSVFVKELQGDYYNVVGFPLNLFYRNMKKFAPELLPTPLASNA